MYTQGILSSILSILIFVIWDQINNIWDSGKNIYTLNVVDLVVVLIVLEPI
jgi:hypothetical protein